LRCGFAVRDNHATPKWDQVQGRLWVEFPRSAARAARSGACALAEACLATGWIEEALSAVREALAETEETEARYYEAELNRLEGAVRGLVGIEGGVVSGS
jgi:hypothetical protein